MMKTPRRRSRIQRERARATTLAVIDDNRLFGEGLAGLVREHGEFRVVALATDGATALVMVRTAKPEIVLLDAGLEQGESRALIAAIRTDLPDTRVVVMGLLPTEQDVAEMVNMGAAGFLLKDASFDEFLATIRAVATGARVLPPRLAGSLFDQIVRRAVLTNVSPAADQALTSREQQVIAHIGKGLSNKAIASRLLISPHTVKSHVCNILEKLAVHSRLELALLHHDDQADHSDTD